MKKVSKEDYNVLSKYHTGEVRYYIDFNSVGSKKTKAAINGTSKQSKNNAPLLLKKSSHEFRDGSLGEYLYPIIVAQFENDPTKVIGRMDLTEQVTAESVKTKQQVSAFITDCVYSSKVLVVKKEVS